jgi:hypothetical protein
MDLDMKIYTDIINQQINKKMVSVLSCTEAMGYTGAGENVPIGPSSADILNSIQKWKEKLTQPPTIEVPRGDMFPMWSQSEYPNIIFNELLGDEDCYIMAGSGVVCGKSAYDKIWEYGYIAIWDGDEPELSFDFNSGWRG